MKKAKQLLLSAANDSHMCRLVDESLRSGDTCRIGRALEHYAEAKDMRPVNSVIDRRTIGLCIAGISLFIFLAWRVNA